MRLLRSRRPGASKGWLAPRLGIRLLPWLLGLVILVGLGSATALAFTRPMTQGLRVPSSVHIGPPAPPESPGLEVGVGLHVRNIYNLSLVDQSFLAEGWYWYHWGDEIQAKLEAFDVKPDELLEMSNEIELGQYSVREVSSSSAAVKRPGQYGQIVRFSGKFYLDDVPQRYAPFDPQAVSIDLEVKPEVFALQPNRIVLKPDNSPASIVGEDLSISGYELDSVKWRQSLVSYPKDFLPGPTMRFSRLSAIFVYGKNAWAVLMKWIFPIFIVVGIVIVSPSIEGALGDIRIAIPPSALLTLVVMQDSYKNSFPPAPYLTYLDELYVYSYIVCLAIFLLFLVSTNLMTRVPEADRERVALKVNRIDRVVQISMLTGLFLVGVVGWFT